MHTAHITEDFLADFGFPTTKEKLRGRFFTKREEVLKAFKEELEKLDKADFQKCLDSWLHRHLEKCIRVGKEYMEKS